MEISGRNILIITQAAAYPLHFLCMLLPCVNTAVFGSEFLNGYEAWLGDGGGHPSFGGVLYVFLIIIACLFGIAKLFSESVFINKWGTYSILASSALLSLLSFCGATGLMNSGLSGEYLTLSFGSVLLGVLDLLLAVCSALAILRPEILEIPFKHN